MRLDTARVSRLPDGRYSIRNDRDESLIEAVKSSCKGRGQWNPRFRNWLIAEDEIASVLKNIVAATAT